MSRLQRPPPQTDAQLIREMMGRIRNLENRNTLRLGDWVLSNDEAGSLIATKPGATLDVGDPVIESFDLTAMRGYVSEAEVAQAVSRGQTSDLNAAAEVQIVDDLNTGNAQYTADNANALAAAIQAQLDAGDTGIFLPDSFDRPMANDFGPDYTMLASTGANHYGTKGDGTAGHTTPVGGSGNQQWLFRNNTALLTTRQRVSATVTSAFVAGADPSLNASLNLCARVSADMSSQIVATVEYNRCCIGYYTDLISGVPFVNLSGWVPCTTSPGDSFDFWCGLSTSGDGRFDFALLRNKLTVCTASDIPQNTAPMLANLYGAVGVRTGTIVYFFYTITQPAVTLSSINIADRVNTS